MCPPKLQDPFKNYFRLNLVFESYRTSNLTYEFDQQNENILFSADFLNGPADLVNSILQINLENGTQLNLIMSNTAYLFKLPNDLIGQKIEAQLVSNNLTVLSLKELEQKYAVLESEEEEEDDLVIFLEIDPHIFSLNVSSMLFAFDKNKTLSFDINIQKNNIQASLITYSNKLEILLRK